MLNQDELLAGVLADIKAELGRVRESVHDLRGAVNVQIGKSDLAQLKAESNLALMQKDIDHLTERLDRNQTDIARQFQDHQQAFDRKFAEHCTIIDEKFAAMKIIRRDWVGWFVAAGILAINLLAQKYRWLQ